MARQPRSLESLLADVAVSSRGDRSELFSTPAMAAVGTDMIEDGAVTVDILHDDFKADLAQRIDEAAASIVTADRIADGAITANSIADFALTVKKFKSDRHHLY